MWRALYLGFVAATAAVAIYHNGGDWFRSHDLDTEFRDQFHLPAPLDFASAPKRAGGRDPCAGMGLVQAEMQFSDADFARYESSLSDPTVWRPTPLRHYNTNISDYHFAEDALTWRPIIRRASGAFAYDGRDTRTIQTYSEFNDVSNGKYLCYAIEVEKQSLRDLPEAVGYPDIRIQSCDSPAIAGRPVGYEPRAHVLAILDSARRRLKMTIVFSHSPQYCAAARNRPLMERFR